MFYIWLYFTDQVSFSLDEEEIYISYAIENDRAIVTFKLIWGDLNLGQGRIIVCLLSKIIINLIIAI